MAVEEKHSIARQIWIAWSSGLCDALKAHRIVVFLWKSSMIRTRTVQCIGLNCIFFVGWLTFFNLVIARLLRWLLPAFVARPSVDAVVNVLYTCVWVFPMIVVSLILNARWYQHIADASFRVLDGKEKKQVKKDVVAGPFQILVTELYRVFLFGAYICMMKAMALVPAVGSVFSFILSCFLVSMYSFEYIFSYKTWTSKERMSYVERHWIYFLGFGAPCSGLCAIVAREAPQFLDTALFSCLFPFLILMAIRAVPVRPKARGLQYFPFLGLVDHLTASAVKMGSRFL